MTMTMTKNREPLGADFSEGDCRLIDAFVTGHLAGNPVEGARRPRKPAESAANA